MGINITMDLFIASIICLSGFSLVVAELPTPTISGDVLSFERDPNHQKITIECDPGTELAEGQFIQIYKKEISFPRVDGTESVVPGTNNGALLYVLSTNETKNEALPADRYTVGKVGRKFVVTIANPVAEDSGIFACRAVAEDTTSTTVDHQESGTANITIIANVERIEFALINSTSVTDLSSSDVVQGTVALNKEDDLIIACVIYFSTGVPRVDAYWITDELETKVDSGAWHRQDHIFTPWIPDESGFFGSLSRGVILWARTSEIPNIGARNEQELQCTAVFSDTPLPEKDVRIAVTSTTPPDPNGDGVSDGGDNDGDSGTTPLDHTGDGVSDGGDSGGDTTPLGPTGDGGSDGGDNGCDSVTKISLSSMWACLLISGLTWLQ